MDDGVQSLPACLASAGTKPISYCLELQVYSIISWSAAAGENTARDGREWVQWLMSSPHKGKRVGVPTIEVELDIGRRDDSCQEACLCLVGLEVGRPVGRHGEATALRCGGSTVPVASQLVQG